MTTRRRWVLERATSGDEEALVLRAGQKAQELISA